jgi:hypothetical protein
MQSSTTETTASTSTPSNAGAETAAVSSGANNYFWILPFTIACAIIYWYLTKRRDLPAENPKLNSESVKSKGKANAVTSSQSKSSVAEESDGDAPRPKPLKPISKKKLKNKRKDVAKPQTQVASSQPSAGLSKRERKMLAARLTPTDTGSTTVTKSMASSTSDSSSNETNPQPAKANFDKAIFEPIRVAATAVKPTVEIEQGLKVEPKLESPAEVTSKPSSKSGVFVPQKRESIVADRNADRWGAFETSVATIAPKQPSLADEDGSATFAQRSRASEEPEQVLPAQGSSRSGLRNFVSKVRAKTTSGAEASDSTD